MSKIAFIFFKIEFRDIGSCLRSKILTDSCSAIDFTLNKTLHRVFIGCAQLYYSSHDVIAEDGDHLGLHLNGLPQACSTATTSS